jgi:two-component sensor histidine kinase
MLAAQLVAQNAHLGLGEINTISSHLDLVLESLRNPPRPDTNLAKEIEDLKATWAGIANLTCEFRGNALAYLDTSPELRFAFIEILREAVSNAVKHGEAKLINVGVDVISSSLWLTVSNDGKAPKITNEQSVGSEMLDELTQTWSLKFHEQTKTVQLKAQIALGKH